MFIIVFLLNLALCFVIDLAVSYQELVMKAPVSIKHVLVKGQLISERKDQIILATGRGILADFWVPHEIDI